MKKVYPVLLAMILVPFIMAAQTAGQTPPSQESKDKKTPLFGISFSGYVKTDVFFDSRQTVSLREGHFLLFPENEKTDADGLDINARGSFNFLSIQTRLAGSITGPDALGAKTSGYIEAEFFGNINPNINTFRLRHALVKLNWKTTELLVGQWWHPMFVPECSPATVSFNTGAPFVVFSRNPQIRLTQSVGKLKLSLAFLSQVDFMSDGPDGANAKYLRNSILPETDFQLQYASVNEERGTEFMIGAGINYLQLTPRLSTTVILAPSYDTVINNIVYHQSEVSATYRTKTRVSAIAANLYAKLRLRNITLKAGGEYGDDNNAYTMLGGYAVKSVTDTAKNFVDYANIRSFTVWAEFQTNGKKWQPGLFLAYGKNLGAGETVTGPYYARGSNIDYAYRISPRLVFNIHKLRMAGELEYTVAAYGTTTGKGYVTGSHEVGNLRALLGIYYFF